MYSLLKWVESWFRHPGRSALAGLGIALGLWLLVVPVQAFDGGIQVLEEHREVEFPDDLSFTMTAEADQDIVEVQLLFRTVGSDVWSYAYAIFNPGRRITTSLDLRVGGLTYLPPNIELEYYYVIHDAQGNVHRTPAQLVEYADNRFQWETTQVGPLELLYHDLSRSRVKAVSREVEEALDRISSLLRVEDIRPIKGVIYNSNAEAQAAFPRQSETITEAQVFGGFAFPPNGIFVGVGFRTGIIVHEAAHLLLDQALGPKALPVPAWLNEGFASYVAPGSVPYSGRSLSSRGLSLRAMARVSGTPQTIATFYLKSESVVGYLIEEFGVESFQQFISKLADQIVTDDALIQTYGFDTAGLEARWFSDDQRPPAPAPGSSAAGSPWVNFSGLVLGALGVVVLVSVTLRYVVRKLRPSHGPEDRLQPWEDPDYWDPESGDRD